VVLQIALRLAEKWRVSKGSLRRGLAAPFAAEGEDKEGHHEHADEGFDGGFDGGY